MLPPARALQFHAVSVRKGLALGVIVGGLGVLLHPTSTAQRLEGDYALRLLFGLRGTVPPPRDVAIVSIDKGSAQQLGLDPAEWPPPRHVHAEVLRAVCGAGASVVVMDIWFPRHRTPEEDDDLIGAVAGCGNVVLVQRLERPRVPGAGVETELLQSPIGELQRAALALAPFPLPRSTPVMSFWPFVETPRGNVPTLPAAALQVRALPWLNRLRSVLRDTGTRLPEDVPLRVRSPADSERLMLRLRKAFQDDPSLAERVRLRLDALGAQLTTTERSALDALVGLYEESGPLYLNLYGPPGTINTIPYHELLQEPRRASELRGRAVFVGESPTALLTTATIADSYPTIYSTREGMDLSGTELGATALANLLTGRLLKPLGPLRASVLVFLFGALVGFMARTLPGVRATPIALLIVVAAIAMSWRLFASRSLVVPLAVPILVQVPLALFLGVLARYRDIRRQTPVELDPDAAQELFVGVCLTTDVESYTALAKRLSPSELRDLLGEYHALLRAIVTRHRGLVWGRGGDSALAVWKASRRSAWPMPFVSRSVSQPGPANDEGRLNACHAALEIQDAIDAFNRRHGETAQMRTRIGLDTGILGLGPVAGELQAVGNAANVATRIQHLNKRLGTRLLASTAVVEGLDALIVRPLGRFALDGVAEPVGIAEIRGLRTAESDADRRLREDFAMGLALYERGDWPAAVEHYRRLEREWPNDGPVRYYRGMAERQGRMEPTAGESAPLIGSDRRDGTE